MAISKYAPLAFITRLFASVEANLVEEAQYPPVTCNLPSDIRVQNTFNMAKWVRRGACIRSTVNGTACYETLGSLLNNLHSLRAAEFNGAAGVLALLPTLGDLLGAPKEEIWRLWVMIPLGGYIAMLLSFGGGNLPVRIHDYVGFMGTENDGASTNKAKRGTEEEISGEEDLFSTESKMRLLLEKLDERLHHYNGISLQRTTIWLGLAAMMVLLLGVQVIMYVVEKAAVLSWWCESGWWFHMWYLLVTVNTILDNWVQAPYSTQSTLYLSVVPYDVLVSGGDDCSLALDHLIGQSQPGDKTEGASKRIQKQLASLLAGKLEIRSSSIRATPPSSVLVVISTLSRRLNEKTAILYRLFSKLISIAVFAIGTSFFCSAQLLPTSMAITVLILVVTAAVSSRAITFYIPASVEDCTPLLHVIVSTSLEANWIISTILKSSRIDTRDPDDTKRAIQVEFDGHIFVDCRRVARRSPYYIRVLGLLGRPFDLAGLMKENE